MMLPPERRPNLLGVGAAKAGTTWLASVLAVHPDIFMPPQKELNALHYNDLEARLGEYAEYFRGGETREVRCDFSVRYLASPNAVQAARRYTPDARILAVLRNPLDQVQSHYSHLRRQNFHQKAVVDPAPCLFEALDRFPVLLLEPALYGKHLARWLDAFPRERVLALTYEELTRAQAASLDRICDFLEIRRRDFAVDAAAISAREGRGGVQPRGGLLKRIYPMAYVVATRYGLQPLKEAIGVRPVETIKRALRLRQISEAVFFRPGYEKLDASGRLQLWAYFGEDVARLESLTGLDLSHWMPGEMPAAHSAGGSATSC